MSMRRWLAQIVVIVPLVVASSTLSAQRHRAVASAPPRDLTYAEGGYADRTSVVQGGTITFHLASAVARVDLEIFNRANTATPVTKISGLAVSPRDCNGLYATGCNWPATTSLTVPLSWPSGIYAAKFAGSKGPLYVPFVVRAANPARTSPILVISATNTFQAYNTFGGRSVYTQPTAPRSSRVSFDRPYSIDSGLARIADWDQPFLNWLTSRGRVVEYASDNDLEDPTFLGRYKELVLAGHSEYWTLAMRQNVERFSAIGGHIAIFGGNTMWWQARYENNGRVLVVYKDAAADPFAATVPSQTTVNWYDWPVLNPENLITGVSFRNAGYVNVGADFAPGPKTTGYTIADPSAWIFGGAAVQAGQVFGNASNGIEDDGALYNCTQNGLVPETSDGSPANFHIVATTPASYGHGTIGYYVNSAGGAVFNAGTRDWVRGLATDPLVQKITETVLDRFATGSFVYDPASNPYRMRELFNCPSDAGTAFPGWHGTFAGAALTSSCAYEGSAGIQLAGSSYIGMYRNFSPTGGTLKHAEVRFYVNADAFNRPKDSTLTMVSLSQRTSATKVRDVLQFKVVATATGKGARLIQLRPDATTAASPVVPLDGGWNSIEISWNSPGSISLQVGTRTPVTISNPLTDEGVNELFLNYEPLASAADSVCLDAIGLGDQKLPDVPGVRF